MDEMHPIINNEMVNDSVELFQLEGIESKK